MLETTIHKLKDIPKIKHNKIADGYIYEKDIYTLPTPLIIELKKGPEYITFNEKTSIITITNHLPTNTYNITLTLQSDTNITINTPHPNEYQLHIYK